jgi:peptidoglycan/xylan/chitin deacetylase (PgdA/CDA1 family)
VSFIYKAFSSVKGDQLIWKLDPSGLRILCYHGVCADEVAKDPWVPSEFVTKTAFDEQMRYLSRNATVLPLQEAHRLLREGSLPPRSVCVTFDDGYANNLKFAYPILQKYGIPATIFLSTAYIETGDFFPFLKFRFVRKRVGTAELLPEYKSNPLDLVMQALDPWWSQVKEELGPLERDVLRPLTLEELQRMDSQLIEFGAHGHTHCILGNESETRRVAEIRTSVRKIGEWANHPVKSFSYPNGMRGDYGELDKQILREENIEVAVCGMRGSNKANIEPLELRRLPIGLYHDNNVFSAEVTGLHYRLLTALGRLPQ